MRGRPIGLLSERGIERGLIVDALPPCVAVTVIGPARGHSELVATR